MPVVSEGHLGGKHSSFYDLFRVENGKIAEHWDVIEEVAAKEAGRTIMISLVLIQLAIKI